MAGLINIVSKLAVPSIIGVGLVQASIYDGQSLYLFPVDRHPYSLSRSIQYPADIVLSSSIVSQVYERR